MRGKIFAREERKKMDEFAAIQRGQRDEEARLEAQQDKDFVLGVLAREKALEMQEEAEKQKARQKAVEFTEALKLEMAKKAESEEKLLELQRDESERQWQKRYAKWEKEELARRGLLKDVYEGRAEQVRFKQEVRDRLKSEVAGDYDKIMEESKRLDEIDAEKERAEGALRKRHQEELFRQMDFREAQRQKDKQLAAIEQRQAAIAEEKLRRALEVEKKRASEVMEAVQQNRKKNAVLAPWATDA